MYALPPGTSSFGPSVGYNPQKVQQRLLQQERDDKSAEFASWAHMRRGLWPGIFTLGLFALFGYPVIAACRIVRDSTAHYWVGDWIAGFVLLVPVLVIFCHVFQARAGMPRFYPTLFSTLVPALIVLLAGYFIVVPISGTVQELLSSDCTTYERKVLLEDAYRSAALAFDDCVQRVALASNSTAKATAQLIDFSDCAEYQRSSASERYAAQWSYLKDLEQTQACSGWCSPGSPMLWQKSHLVADPCSTAAGLLLQGKVNRLGTRMLVMGVVELLVSIWALSHMQEILISVGLEW